MSGRYCGTSRQVHDRIVTGNNDAVDLGYLYADSNSFALYGILLVSFCCNVQNRVVD